MIRIDQLTVNVTIEGEAEAAERGFARLFDKYSALRAGKIAREAERSDMMARDREVAPMAGRR
ncbi:hypothetical protein OKW76_04515 [Sphingomonas sp. S1-29]|uniref:hypothetical protein n=1 Tax=Sphingomonas sp. S1-29 TaxID=2991074 RepID=UPI00223F0B04|nr:hypothetical protein [Sphingomonas sp. S1-29]UZK70314.1 hypothetical protein OKW76_04515 [Sphingomonas sp. S1-29]